MDGVSLSTKNIAIFTTFTSADEAYSLNRVTIDQLKMLLRNGYKVKVIVAEGFQPKGIYTDPNVKIETIPNVPVHNEVKKDETFAEDVEKLYNALKIILQGADIVITHDIIYQNAALKHNMAARKLAQEVPSIRWLHWIHSATSPYTLVTLRNYFEDKYLEVMAKPFPNSFYIYFNDWSVPRIAQNFSVPESSVKVVHHPSDVYEILDIGDEVREISEKYNFLKADAIAVYPVRLDRGKQVEFVIKTMASLKNHDMSVRVVVVDFHSTAGDKVTYRDNLRQVGIDYKLAEGELLFTSDLKPEWKYEIPHTCVLDFMALSNVFVMPSVSESYSLVTQEAGMQGKVVVVNKDFPPFRDIFGKNIIERKFSSNVDILTGQDGFTKTAYGPNDVAPEQRLHYEKKYHYETAGLIKAKLLDGGPMELAMFLRKERNLQHVFKNELEPLFYAP